MKKTHCPHGQCVFVLATTSGTSAAASAVTAYSGVGAVARWRVFGSGAGIDEIGRAHV